MGSWSKAWNKTECLSIPLNRKRRLFYSWAVVLPKFSRKSSLMMRVKTLSKIYQRGGILKGKKGTSTSGCCASLKNTFVPYFRPTEAFKKREKVPCLHKVCVRASWQNTCSVVFLIFCCCCCCFLLVWTCFEVLPIPWEKEIKLQQGKFFDPKQPINNYIQFFLF